MFDQNKNEIASTPVSKFNLTPAVEYPAVPMEKCSVNFTAAHTGQSEGVKHDAGKPDYSLLPPYALEDVVKILTFGAKKYDRDNWKNLTDLENRYFAAAQRHMWARHRGEEVDPESGIDHAAHAICCLLFMAEARHISSTAK